MPAAADWRLVIRQPEPEEGADVQLGALDRDVRGAGPAGGQLPAQRDGHAGQLPRHHPGRGRAEHGGLAGGQHRLQQAENHVL